MFRTLFATAALMLSAGIAHANQACMMEGSGSFMGHPVAVKDCSESASMSQADLQKMCNGLVNAVPGVQGKVTYIDKCPKGYWGGCKNMFGKPIDAYYYHPDADRQKGAPIGCKQFGGTWVNAN